MARTINKSMKEHCNDLITLLQEKGPCDLDTIQKHLNKKRRTVYYIIDYLKESRIISKNEATKEYFLKNKKSLLLCSKSRADEFEELDQLEIDAWLILLMMASCKYHLIPDLHMHYNNSTFQDLSDGKFRARLNYLIKKGYINKQSKEYNKYILTFSEIAPMVSCIEKSDIWRSFPNYYLNFGHAGEEGVTLKKIAEKFSVIIPDYTVDTFSEFISFGRFNDIDEKIKNKLKDYLKLNFRKKIIEIKYHDSQQKIINTMLKTGLIVYSIEKNSFYIFGINEKKERIIIRLDSILSAKETNKENPIEYYNKEFKDIYNRMYSISIDKPESVEILFENKSRIRKKIESLINLRSDTAQIEYPKDKEEWFLYKDEIAGFNDFLPFIRSFGSSAVILKPSYARTDTVEKTSLLIRKYKEILND